MRQCKNKQHAGQYVQQHTSTGDTLWQIAETYLGKGSRYTEIVKLNGLKSNVLYTGQVLALPEK